MKVILIHPDATPEHLGEIPQMLDEDDPRPAREQFDEFYQHGGGWQPNPRLKLQLSGAEVTLSYPGDPPYHLLASMQLHDEVIWIFDHALVVIVQPDGAYEVCRMD